MAKLYFYYSSMNAGKSATLLQSDFNYRERGMATMLWTAAVDDRYGRGRIVSRIGLEAQAHLFEPGVDMLAVAALTTCLSSASGSGAGGLAGAGVV